MPLTNNVIIKLNEITTLVEDKNNLKESEIEEIKTIFRGMIESGERYDLDDIESWFENEGSWQDKNSRVRVVNLAHYVQNKFQQTLKLNIISDDDCGVEISLLV
jgi:exoribonuclease II